MNKILAGLVAVASVFATFSCSEDDSYTPAEPETGVKPYVYFSENNETTLSLEPTAPAELTFTVCRQDTKDAIEMPLIVTENTSNVFNVPSSVSFAAGEESVDVTVTFPDAPIGTPCSLTVGFSSEYTGIYYSGIGQQTFTVNRVKWNNVGYVVSQSGEKIEGWAMFTDDYVTGFFGVQNVSYPIEVQERDDVRGLFRLKNVYGASYPYNEPGDYDDTQDYYITIDATNPNKVYIPELTDLGFDWGYGNFYIWSLAGYYLNKGNAASAEENYGTYKNGAITFPKDALMIAMKDYNDMGLYTCNSSGLWKVVLDPSLQKYEADIENDFEYDEEIADGEFYSNLLGKSSSASLYVGTCAETKDDCDKVFEEKYGKIYKLVSPYAEDYNLTFFVKDGSVSVPDGDKYALQATGLQSLGQDVYAKINGSASSYEDGKLVLNITFTNGDKKNEIIYGTYDEVLESINWINLGTGSYTDAFIAPLFGEDALTYNVEILECEQKPGLYRVMNPYSNSVYPFADDDCAEDGKFVEIDATDPDGVLLNQQALGFDWGYGEFNIISIGSYFLQYQGVAKATLKKAGYLGTLKDGVITFPVPEDQGVGGLVIMGGKAYNADTDGSFKVVLPSPAAEVQAMNSAVKMSASNKSLNNSMYKFEMPSKYNFTVRKEGKAPAVKRSKDFAPSQIKAPKF